MILTICDPGPASGAFVLMDTDNQKASGYKMPREEKDLINLMDDLSGRSNIYLMEHITAPHRGGLNAVRNSINLAENTAQLRILARMMWTDANTYLVPPKVWQKVIPYAEEPPVRPKKPKQTDAANKAEYKAMEDRHNKALEEHRKLKKDWDDRRKEYYRRSALEYLEKDGYSISGMLHKGELVKSYGYADAVLMGRWFLEKGYDRDRPDTLVLNG